MGSTYPINGFPDEDEIALDSSIAGFINILACLTNWDVHDNWYGEDTTTSNIYLASASHEEAYGIAWHIGHGAYDWHWNFPFIEQQYYILNDDGGKVYDDDIFNSYPSYQTNFSLLWACHSADTRGGPHQYSGNPHGMPYAFLSTCDLSTDGYADPWATPSGSVFIGWTPNAPGLSATINDVDEAGYYFLLHFYVKSLYGNSINEALDYTSNQVWGVDFVDTDFYNGFSSGGYPYQMKVYGDGDHTILQG